MTGVRPLSPRALRRISLLRTLRTANHNGINPTINELVVVNHGQDDISRHVREKRRAYITGMIQRGLINVTYETDSSKVRLVITSHGLRNLEDLGYPFATPEK